MRSRHATTSGRVLPDDTRRGASHGARETGLDTLEVLPGASGNNNQPTERVSQDESAVFEEVYVAKVGLRPCTSV